MFIATLKGGAECDPGAMRPGKRDDDQNGVLSEANGQMK